MRIILFSDGTGNSSAMLFRTNVWRLYEGLHLGSGGDQVAFYDDGVGTASFKPLAFIGGAFGFGLKRNVLDIYKFLCRNHAQGGPHQIYAFGFSRGAFTIRVLLGLLRRQGLVRYTGDIAGDSASRSRQRSDRAHPEQELARLATWAYRAYRAEANPTGGLVRPLRYLRDRVLRAFDRIRGLPPYDPGQNVTTLDVEFVGVWDTVSAYGLPIIELTRGWDLWVWPFSLPTRELSPQVKKACHALSLDDERQTFHPLLWDEKKQSSDATTIADERVSQVWFAGMHSNLGGGYPDDGMVYDSLVWIAEQAGLTLRAGVMDEWKSRRTPSSPMADSRKGTAAYYRYQPRNLAVLTNDRQAGVQIARPKIHESVFARLRQRIHDYAPIVLPDRYAVVDTEGAIHDLPAAATNVAATPTAPETVQQARTRIDQQQTVWDLVWLRRVQYFLTVLVTCALVLLPLLEGSWQRHFLPWSVPTLVATIAAVRVVLPGWLGLWLDYFERYPLHLAAGAFLLVVLLAAGGAIERRIQDTMWAIWQRTWTGRASRMLAPVRALRTARAYQRTVDALRHVIVPNVFGVVMLLLIVLGTGVAIRRVTFSARMITGSLCRNVSAPAVVQPGAPARSVFDTASICQSTGIALQPDVTYQIRITRADEWLDDLKPVPSLGGFRSDAPVFFAAVPLRRHLRLNWFVPVARVGSRGDESYPLTSEVTTLRPRLAGQLFLYVNDAIAPPMSFFYGNNSGHAVVEVSVRAGS